MKAKLRWFYDLLLGMLHAHLICDSLRYAVWFTGGPAPYEGGNRTGAVDKRSYRVVECSPKCVAMCLSAGKEEAQ
jgi:hypothetical protein